MLRASGGVQNGGNMLKDIAEKINRLKREKDVCILAHCYQSEDILEIADHVGDSFGLAEKAAQARQKAAQAGKTKDKQTKRSSSLARGRGEKRGRTAPGTARRDEIN